MDKAKLKSRPSTGSSQQANFQPLPLRPFTAQFCVPQFLVLALFVSQLKQNTVIQTGVNDTFALPSLFLQARTGQNT